ncbi:hypothetical protein ABZS66_38330 [Dactylosporangium sp. NPDC005572]|uniref:hypothetical protein n=1 Tax=Dactylosporangium sp. NPDC005572 TaxID=3156889 RepID=UPI0033B8CC64
MQAIYARGSARSAERQAKAAEEQLRLSKAQADAAETQLEIAKAQSEAAEQQLAIAKAQYLDDLEDRKKAEADKASQQARLVFGVFGGGGIKDYTVAVANNSPHPIYSVVGTLYTYNVSAGDAVPAARQDGFRIFSAIRLDSLASVTRSEKILSPKQFEILRREGVSASVELTFTDSSGLMWRRWDRREPERIFETEW